MYLTRAMHPNGNTQLHCIPFSDYIYHSIHGNNHLNLLHSTGLGEAKGHDNSTSCHIII